MLGLVIHSDNIVIIVFIVFTCGFFFYGFSFLLFLNMKTTTIQQDFMVGLLLVFGADKFTLS